MIVVNIQDEKKLHYKYKISYDKAQIAKYKVFEHLFGSYKESFKKLPRLLLAINELNLRITVDQMHKENLDDNIVVFERVFQLFELSIEDFKYCRPLISVDDTYLYR